MRSIRLRPVASLAPLLAVLLLSASCSSDSGSPAEPPGEFTLTVNVTGDGSGTVTSSPAGIVCTTGSDPCTADFEEGTSVTLAAAPASTDDAFAGWSGACTGSGSCSLTLNADASVTAAFDDPTVTTQTVGSAGGTISSADGSLRLVFPAGAVSSDLDVTLSSVDASGLTGELGTLRDAVGISRAFDLGPDGTEFAQPVQVTFEPGSRLDVGAGAYQTGLLLLTSGSETAQLDEQTIDIEPVTGALTIEGTLTRFSTMSALDGGLTFDVTPPPAPLHVGVQLNLTTSLSVQSDLGSILSGQSAFFRDRSSVNLVPGFQGDFTLAEVSPGRQWGGSPSYTCSQAGSAELHYGMGIGSSGGGILHTSSRNLACEAVPPQTLDVQFFGAGGGQVTSDPAGLDCVSGSVCSADFAGGSEVTLTATAGSDSNFYGWSDPSGSSLGSSAQLAITLNVGKTVRACFSQKPTYQRLPT